MQRYHSIAGGKSAIREEIGFHAFVRMIGINEHDIDWLTPEYRFHLHQCIGAVRIASNKMQGLTGLGESVIEPLLPAGIASPISPKWQVNAYNRRIVSGETAEQ